MMVARSRELECLNKAINQIILARKITILGHRYDR